MKILVIDDHVLIRQAMQGVLKKLRRDAVVLEAPNYKQAMQVIANHPDISLILLDLTLPDRDGFSVLAELRERYPAVSIVVLSAVQDPANVIKALDMGALGFIPKSAQGDVILHALRLVISGGIYIPPEILVREELSNSALRQPGGDRVPAAIAGAYTFVTWDFFARVQRRNLLIGDILRGGLRLAIAIPLGLALSTLSDGVAPFLAFAVGVFPLDTISTILRQLANKKLNLELGAAEAQSQVGKLSDIDSTIADRIEDADITTIAQLAWCDPIQLTMRTNLYFAFITDIVSQALAWVYLETKLNLLRPFGLRGAFEIRIFLGDDLASADAREKAQAEAVLAAAAIAVSMSVDSLRYSFEQIAYDPSTKFLSEAS